MTYKVLRLSSLIFYILFGLVWPCWGQTELLGVELARGIVNRAPIRPYSPGVFCEKDKNRNAPLPVISATTDHQVVFWNRVTAEKPTTFHHKWLKKTADGWEPMANIPLKVEKSSSFRIWSTKEIHPKLHLGEWMIVVSSGDDPKDVLCIARFIVEQSLNTNTASRSR